MNDLKSDLFPSLDCLRGDVALKGEEPGRRGRVHLGEGGVVFGENSGGNCTNISALLSTHHTWIVYFE